MVPFLAILLLGILLATAWALGANRIDSIVLLAIYAVGLALCLLLGPLVSLTGYREYLYYVEGLATLGIKGTHPLWHWFLAHKPSFPAMFHLTAVLAPILPAVTYLVCRTLDLGRRLALATALVFMLSGSFLVYGPGANSMSQLAVAGSLAFLLAYAALQAHLRLPVALLMAGLSACFGLLAWFAKPEGFLVPLLVLTMIALQGRASRRYRLQVAGVFMLAWVSLVLLFLPTMLEVVVPYLAHRIVHRGPTMLEELIQSILFLFANGFLLFATLGVYNAVKLKEPRVLKSVFMIPILGYSGLYALGGDHLRHQLILLPFLLALTGAGLADLWRHRRVLAGIVGAGMAVWIAMTGLVDLVAFMHDPKQAEYDQLLQKIDRPRDVYYMPYSGDNSEPQLPLLALADPAVQIVELHPPAVCPPNLFHALAVLHHQCTRDNDILERCRRAVEETGPDWVAQAAALTDIAGSRLGELLSHRSPPQRQANAVPSNGSGQAAIEAREQDKADGVFFVPVWARVRRAKFFYSGTNHHLTSPGVRELILECLFHYHNDTTAWRFAEFNWLDAAGLALEMDAANVSTAGRTFLGAVPREGEQSRAACQRVRERPEGARLFDLLWSLHAR